MFTYSEGRVIFKDPKTDDGTKKSDKGLMAVHMLIVSHGIFSKGFNLAHIDAIYTTDSFKEFENLPDNISCFPVSHYL